MYILTYYIIIFIMNLEYSICIRLTVRKYRRMLYAKTKNYLKCIKYLNRKEACLTAGRISSTIKAVVFHALLILWLFQKTKRDSLQIRKRKYQKNTFRYSSKRLSCHQTKSAKEKLSVNGYIKKEINKKDNVVIDENLLLESDILLEKIKDTLSDICRYSIILEKKDSDLKGKYDKVISEAAVLKENIRFCTSHAQLITYGFELEKYQKIAYKMGLMIYGI